MDWSSFFPDLVAIIVGAFLGAFLGFFLALRLDRSKTNQRNQGRRGHLLSVLRATLEKNDGLVRQILGEFDEHGNRYLQYYHLDMVLLNATAHEAFELLPQNLVDSLNSVRYELAHMARKVDARMMCYVHHEVAAGQDLEDLAVSIRKHSNRVLAEIRGTLDAIDEAS